MELISPLEAGEHLVILVASALLIVARLRGGTAPASRSTFLLSGALAGLPVVFGVLPAELELLIDGKEGVLEALTGGVLLALVVLGARRRSPWVLAGAAFLLLEEIDYGQLWLGFGSPPALLEAGSHSGNFNSHNLPVIEALWRLIPLLAVLALAGHRRWPVAVRRLADRLRLPRLDPGLLVGCATLILGTLGTWLLAGEERADEAAELAVVALVAVSWWSEEGER